MIIHNVEQGSEEWKKLKLGIPTASEFFKILSPTGEPSKQFSAYANKLIAETMMGKPYDSFEPTEFMHRGTVMEAEAVAAYSLIKDIDPEVVGFCTNDQKTYGCSPDRFVGKNGGLEIKCPAPHTHVEYMATHKIEQKYYPQVQGNMLVSEREWWDTVSYHPEMRPVIIRVGRDDAYIKKLEKSLERFNNTINSRIETLIKRGYIDQTNQEKLK